MAAFLLCIFSTTSFDHTNFYMCLDCRLVPSEVPLAVPGRHICFGANLVGIGYCETTEPHDVVQVLCSTKFCCLFFNARPWYLSLLLLLFFVSLSLLCLFFLLFLSHTLFSLLYTSCYSVICCTPNGAADSNVTTDPLAWSFFVLDLGPT